MTRDEVIEAIKQNRTVERLDLSGLDLSGADLTGGRFEEVQSGSTRYLVEDTLTMQAKNADHTAEEIVRINAEQVHLG